MPLMRQVNVSANESIKKEHKLLGLDHLRAFAIVYVFLYHYQFFGHPDWESKISKFGWTGVDLFFVLSGFLISRQFFSAIAKGKIISMRAFFVKRFFRIIPPFMVVIVLYAAIPGLREQGQLAPLWEYLTFTLNLSFDLNKYRTFTHAWSLCVEEQFYLILPLSFWLFNYLKAGKRSAYFLLALFIAGIIIRLWGWYHFVQPHLSSGNYVATWFDHIYFPTYNRLDGLLIGVVIAGLFTFHPGIKEWINRRSNILLLVGLLILAAAYFVCTPQVAFSTSIFGFPLVSLGYGVIVAAIICPNCIFYKIKSVITSQLAALSYSIYLIHKMVIHITQYELGNMGIEKRGNLMMLICILATLAAALIMRYTIEKPALRLRNKILYKWSYSKEPKLVN
jgi:peptidoglycan/LPS O-acetylase OafA/YrhL